MPIKLSMVSMRSPPFIKFPKGYLCKQRSQSSGMRTNRTPIGNALGSKNL